MFKWFWTIFSLDAPDRMTYNLLPAFVDGYKYSGHIPVTKGLSPSAVIAPSLPVFKAICYCQLID